MHYRRFRTIKFLLIQYLNLDKFHLVEYVSQKPILLAKLGELYDKAHYGCWGNFESDRRLSKVMSVIGVSGLVPSQQHFLALKVTPNTSVRCLLADRHRSETSCE